MQAVFIDDSGKAEAADKTDIRPPKAAP